MLLCVLHGVPKPLIVTLIYISWSCTGRRLISHVHVPQHYCYLIIIIITSINVVYYMFMYTSVENKYF